MIIFCYSNCYHTITHFLNLNEIKVGCRLYYFWGALSGRRVVTLITQFRLVVIAALANTKHIADKTNTGTKLMNGSLRHL